jgi:hypothetical protein
MRLSFSPSRWHSPKPLSRTDFEPPQVRAARDWVATLPDGDHVYAEVHAACENAIGFEVASVTLPILLRQAGFEKYRAGRRKITRYRRGRRTETRHVGRAAAAPRQAPQPDSDGVILFRRWTRQVASGVYTFATLRDSFMEWCVDGHVDPVKDSVLGIWLKDEGFIRHRVGHHKLTIYEKPAAGKLAAA